MLLDKVRNLHVCNNDHLGGHNDRDTLTINSTTGDSDVDTTISNSINAELFCNQSDMIQKELQQRIATSKNADNSCVDDNHKHSVDDSVCSGSTGMLISAADLQQLDNGELQDLGRLVWIAEYLSSKHIDKKNMRDVVKPLVTTIRSSAESIDMIESDVHELFLSAKTSIDCLADAHSNMCKIYETPVQTDAQTTAPTQIPSNTQSSAKTPSSLSASEQTLSNTQSKTHAVQSHSSFVTESCNSSDTNTLSKTVTKKRTCESGGCSISIPELRDIEIND